MTMAQVQLEVIPQGKKARPWWEKVDTRYLLRRLHISADRMEIAAILVELADRAERNTALQEILRKMQLRPPFDIFEYRKGEKRKGFWVRIPHTREHPSMSQSETRLEFSEIAYSLFGTKGTVERLDGTRIGRLNDIQGEVMRGMKFVSEDEKAERQRQKAMERIVEAAAPTCP